MPALDLLASMPHYRAHAEPAWLALPAELRGKLLAGPQQPRRGSGACRAALVASGHDLAHAVRSGYARIAYIEHGYGQSYGAAPGYPGGRGRQHVELFLSPNATAAAADAGAYPGARVVVVGDPALEGLPALEAASGQKPLVAVSFHWDCPVAPEALSSLGHYRRALPALAERYQLLGHGHPKARGQLEPLWRKLGVEWVGSWHEVLRRASVYVTDASSTLYEFASTGRPVVVLNAPWYRRNVEHGLRFWRAASVGVQVDEPALLVGSVSEALADPPGLRRAREAALRVVYAHRGEAAERAARALEVWLT